MRRSYLLWLSIFSLAITSACAAPPGLPENPTDWVCTGSDKPLSPQQIQTWCEAHPDRGQRHHFTHQPTTLANIEQKNKFDEELRDFLRSGKDTE